MDMMAKRKENRSSWTSAVSDFRLWQDDDENSEEEEEASPLFKHASNEQQHTQDRGNVKQTSSVTQRPPSARTVGNLAYSNVTSTAKVNKETSITSSRSLSTAPTMSSLSSTVTNGTPRKPWEYAKQTQLGSVTSISYSLPSAPVVDETIDEPSVTLGDTLPPYVYRKPGKLTGPSQQTIRIPFAEVENGLPCREAVPIQTTPSVPPKTALSSPWQYRQEQSSSSSTTPSQLFDSTSSRTVASSSPYHGSQTKSPSKRTASYSQSNSTQKRPQPARVTYRKGITNQAKLAFTPVPRSRQSLKGSFSNLSPSVSHHSNSSPRQQPALAEPPPRHFVSPYSSHTESGELNKPFQIDPYERFRPSTITFQSGKDYETRGMQPSSSRSAMDQAIDREFHRSFEDSPVRGRIAADYQASNGDHWRSKDYSEGDRRVLEYPQIFDSDPDRNLKQSAKKLFQFGWSTRRNRGAALMQNNLPSAPRLGAASKSKSRSLTAQVVKERSLGKLTQSSSIHTAQGRLKGSPTSETSDEFECDFDYQGLCEEDLARLEAEYSAAQ